MILIGGYYLLSLL